MPRSLEIACPTCGGSGTADEDTCPTCAGLGKNWNANLEKMVTCGTCKGEGTVSGRCPTCKGSKKISISND